MSKDYLEVLAKNIRYKKEYIGNDTYRLYIKKNEMEFLEQALQRLETIDNSKPSEALEWLQKRKQEIIQFYGRLFDSDVEVFKKIEPALLKAQEQEKVLDVIKKKNVMAFLLKVCKSIDEYNFHTSEKDELTPEEFDLLKRWVK